MALILQYSASAEGEWDGAATLTSQASPEKLSEPLRKHASRFYTRGRDTETHTGSVWHSGMHAEAIQSGAQGYIQCDPINRI